jgi:broad specificity phosphatase PhoE
MTTTLIFIRHGLTDWNAEGRWQGHEDIPLNETGVAQAQALARRLSSWPIQNLYSSDLKRAAQTAKIVGQSLGLQPVYDPRWRERDVGMFQGLTWQEIQVHYPLAYEKMKSGLIDPPKGESNEALYDRAARAFDWLAARHEGEMIGVVSHGAYLHTLLLYVLDMPAGQYGKLSLRGNTGINIVEVTNGHPRLCLLNDTAHLDSFDGSQPPDLT